MKIKITFVILIIVAFFYMLPQPVQETIKKVEPDPILNHHFIINNVRLYDGDEIFENIDIEIKDNRVYKIAKNIQADESVAMIDAMGKTLLPGLIDAHTHSYGDALKDALNFGVTTELDMFSMPEFTSTILAARDTNLNTTTADLFSSGILATTAGGHGTEYGFKIPVLDSPDQVQQFVKDRIAEGADYIKAVYNSKDAKRQFFPSISQGILKALANNAHNNNIMLVVHIDNLISAKQAIMAGANGLVHSFMDEIVDDELIELMKANNVFMIPTLSVQAAISQLADPLQLINDPYFLGYISKQQKQQLNASFPDFGIPKQGLENAMTSVKILSDAGITILAGTDAPNPGTTHGISIHNELQLLVKSGLSNQQAIHSATGAVKKYFAVGKRGTLKVGALASMILIDGNPFDDISSTRNIVEIWKNGTLFKRLTFHDKDEQTQVEAGLISDFNETIEQTKIGFGISQSTDQYAGGHSVVNLTLKDHVDEEVHNKYLHAKGVLKEGFMFKWSGFSFIPGTDMQNGVNLTDIKSLKFDARAGENTNILSILIFQTGSFQPSEVTVELSQQWATFTIDLEDFKSVDLSDIVNISFVVTKTLGPFEFMLDNLYFAE